jgi:hemerythrin
MGNGWTDSLSVGIAAIDADHRRLFKMLEELRGQLANRAPGYDIDFAFKRLVEFATFHFCREEALLVGNGYPGQGSHKQEHNAFTAQAGQALANFRAGRTDAISPELIDFIETWLIDHIREGDIVFSGFLRDRFAAVPAVSPRSMRFRQTLPALAAPSAGFLAAWAAGGSSAALWSAGLGAVVAIIASLYIAVDLTRTLDAINEALMRLAVNDVDGVVPGGRRSDELGRMAAVAVRFGHREIEQVGQRTAVARPRALDVSAELRGSVGQLMPGVAAIVAVMGEKSIAMRNGGCRP